MSIEILDCLKRQRDICVKNVIPSQNTAFMFTPALISQLKFSKKVTSQYIHEFSGRDGRDGRKGPSGP